MIKNQYLDNPNDDVDYLNRQQEKQNQQKQKEKK